MFLGLLTLVAALLTLAVSATVVQLRASDPAGNGLAQAFLAAGMIALWVVLALALLVAAVRQQRYPLAWSAINLATTVVFVLAVAGQIACLAQLTGRHADGFVRVLLQSVVIGTPVLVLLHIAWRGFGLPIGERVASSGIALTIAVLSVVSLLCVLRPKSDRPLTVESIFLPALLVRDSASVHIVERVEQLTRMSSNYLLSRAADPLVIDSHFDIFELRDLKMQRSALGLLVRGQGMEPVTFRVVPYTPSGTPDAVHELLLRVKSLNADPDIDAAMRRDLAKTQTLDEIIAILSR